ncbi:MAG TPA: peptidoglycan-binding protein [Candidatus Alectryocaccomicrobium excrementavium]|uniref:Peptidoglycan-binding protein n=1 Tax=Candidatus Alectryocaccomicrobium excrementavium TaxID=2840668 RepID=A0A9D1K6P7_9FIRM|nr:peptidoglycan-binding protein [Candidatus Alectryocaccomicrobium excrementavium]
MAYSTIREGSRGEDVKRLQTLLNNEGYSLDVDGIFGDKTQSAVRQYQRSQGLDADGIVGSNTWSSLTAPAQSAQAPAGQVDVSGGRDLTGAASGTAGGYTQGNGSIRLPARPEDYTPSQAVTDAENALKEWEANRPGDYVSQYQDQLDALYNQIVGRGEFSYNPQADPLYEMYKDRYTAGGQLAMQDAMAGAAALSGGYANSYAQTVGQQQLGAYMTALADVLPELEARAYDRWRDEGVDLYNQFQLTQGLDATDYDRYRDTVGDYYNDLDYAYGKWQDLYGNDYNQYLDALAAWQDARDFAYQQAMDALAQQNYEREWAYTQQQNAKKSSGSSSGGSGKKTGTAGGANAPVGAVLGAALGLAGQKQVNDLDEEVMDLYDTIGSNARGAIESSTHSASEKNYMRKQLQRLEEESGKR